MDGKDRGKGKSSALRTRRELQAQQRYSNSSADEDPTDSQMPGPDVAVGPPQNIKPGPTSYGSDETMKAYDVKKAFNNAKVSQDDDNYATEDTDCYGYHENRGSFFSNASEGDVESDGEGISSEQLLQVVDNYLKNKPWDTHSATSSVRTASSRSSLTLTETEQEGSDQQETGPSLNGSERRLLPKGSGSGTCRASQIEDDFQPNFLVQTTSGNFYVPGSTPAPTVNQDVFNNTGTLPISGKTINSPAPAAAISNTLPTNSSRSSGATSSLPRFDPPPPPLPERNPSLYNTSVINEVISSTPPIIPPPAPVLGEPIQPRSATPPSAMVLPQSEPRPYQSIQSLQGTGAHTSMQREDRYHCGEYPGGTMPCSSSAASTTAATTPLPPFTRALHNDFRQPTKIQPTKRQKKKVKPQKMCGTRHWKCLAVVFILVTLVLASVVAYFIATTALGVNWNVNDQPGQVKDGEGSEDSTIDNLNTYKPVDTVFQTNISPTRAPAIVLGQSVKSEIPPGSFSRTLLYIPKARFVEFNVTVPKDSHLAVYAKKGTPPSHTQFDFMQVLDGTKNSPGEELELERATRSQHSYIPVLNELPSLHVEGDTIRRRDVGRSKKVETHRIFEFDGHSRERRSTDAVAYHTFVQYMLLGHWHIAIYNDGLTPEKVSMSTSAHEGPTEPDSSCDGDCSGNGKCIDGQCECYPAYTGDDCSIGVCPVICSGNGFYEDGACQCDIGWKGVECDVPKHECILNCNNHGDCFGGTCVCHQGYKGEYCESVDCTDPTCSGHGVCVEGACHCGHGWMGDGCSQPVPPATAAACPTVAIPTLEHTEEEGDDSEGEGELGEGEGEKMKTEPPAVERCHGNGHYDTVAGVCFCAGKWGGDDCSQEICYVDSDCGLHQQCKMSSCVCKEGWTGEDCMQAYCDPPCSENGRCANGKCVCQPGWNGRQCTIEGCPRACSGHGECRWVNSGWKCFCEPLWKGDGCHIGIENRCNDRRDNDNDGLIDCKDPDCCISMQCISNALCRSVPLPTHLLAQTDPAPPNAPFYEHVSFLAKPNGVQLSAMPFVFTESSHMIAVVRGKVVTADGTPVVGVTVRIKDLPLFGHTLTRSDGMYDMMVRGGGAVTLQFTREPFQSETTSAFVSWGEFVVMDDVTMTTTLAVRERCEGGPFPRPDVVFLSESMAVRGECGDALLADTQTIHDKITIPGTTVTLNYNSKSVPGYQSLIRLQLTPMKHVENLKLVHLKITVQGQIFEKTMEGVRDLKYVYSWNKLNAYGEKTYGSTTATVSVGYEYIGCSNIVWARKATKVDGYNMDTTGVAGWKLSGHHGYNVKQGIVHRGDGTEMKLADDKPPLITSVLGNGRRRSIDCPQCDGKAKGNKLLAPVAVASAPDGSLFVGDFNFIRKIQPDGNVTSVLHLHYFPSRKYYLAVSPLDGSVYMSDTETRQIRKLRYVISPADITDNFELVAGTGGQCLPLDSNRCGDGGPAVQAKLISPKGITIAQDGTIFVVDGSVIRKIDTNGIISTYLGSHDILDAQRPLKCNGPMAFDEIRLEWPVDITVNPVDHALSILDHNVVLRLTPDKQVTIQAGLPVNCMAGVMNQTAARGRDSRAAPNPLATEVMLTNPRAIAFSALGELYISESNNERIHQVRKVNVDGRIVLVAGGEAECDCNLDDCDCFNGDDIQARDAMLFMPSDIAVGPDDRVYIADQGNLRIHAISPNLPVLFHGKQYVIESESTLELYVFNVEGKHMMTRDAVTDEVILEFSYADNNLMKTMTDNSGHILRLTRDLNGRMTTVTTPNGDRYGLAINSDGFLRGVYSSTGQTIGTFNYYGDSGLLATAAEGDNLKTLYRYDEFGRLTTTTEVNAHQEIIDEKMMNLTVTMNNTVIIKFVNGLELQIEPSSYPTMELSSSVPAKRKITLPSGNVHRLEWRFYVRRGGRKNKRTIQVVGRKLRINGINVLTLEYNRFTKTETLHDAANIPQLIISHNSKGLPTEWMPNNGMKSVLVDYDYQGRVSRWRKGFIFENIEYDDEGRIVRKQYSDGSSWRFVYTDGRQPTTIIFPSGQEYLLGYKSGQVSVITTPAKTTYSMERLASIGYYRNMYFINGTQWLLQDYLSNGSPSTTLYTGNLRRVTRLYDGRERLTDVFYDKTAIKYEYYSIEGQLRSIEMKEPYLRSALRYKYHGPLAKESSMRFNREDFVGVEYRYGYDNNFRMSSTQADFDGNVLPACNFTYHPEKGHPQQYCNYTVIQKEWFAEVLSKGDAKVTKQFDAYGRMIIYQLDIRDISVFTMKLKYNNVSYVSERQIKTLGDDETFKFDYDMAGQIVEAMAGNWLSWRYSYDSNGNLVTVVYNDEEYHVRHDSGDRVLQFKEDAYKVDEDGFLVQRGEEEIEYNSNGQLVHVLKSGAYEVWYHYDGMGRRVVQADDQDDRIQYFYGDIENPWRVTHIYNKASEDIWTLMYDLQGFLMSVMIGDRQYYVTTDQVGSPVTVFNSRGELVKQIVYSPFGNIVHDTAADFKLHIGFRGGIHDYATQLVHFRDGDYDPNTGKWTTPQLEMWNWATQTNKHPALNLYVFTGNNPVNLEIGDIKFMKAVTDWLPMLGFSAETMIPYVNTEGELVRDQLYSYSSDLQKKKVFNSDECMAGNLMDSFKHHFFALPTPQILTGALTDGSRSPPTAVNIGSTIFGHSAVLYVQGGQVVTQLVDVNNDHIVKIAKVLNGSEVLEKIHHTDHGKDIHYFVKGRNAMNRDLSIIGSSGGGQLVERIDLNEELSVTVHTLYPGHMNEIANIDIKIHSKYGVLNIRYGATVAEDAARILRHTKQKAIQKAWNRERDLLLQGKDGSRVWTEEERTSIIENRYVDGYDGFYALDVDSYPQLADDSNCIKLLTYEEGAQLAVEQMVDP